MTPDWKIMNGFFIFSIREKGEVNFMFLIYIDSVEIKMLCLTCITYYYFEIFN